MDVRDHEIELTMPDDRSELAGQVARFRISILDARKKEVPALDDEFAKDLDRGETLDELRQSVRADLEKRQAEEIARELREVALRELIKRNPIPVAPSLVERGIEYQHHRMQHVLSMMGMHDHDHDDDDHDHEHEISDEMRERLRPSALEAVRGELLIDAIATQENIAASDDELHERIAEMARARGVPAVRLRAELDRDDELESIRYQLRRDKILDMLIERATVTEVEPAQQDAPGKAAEGAESAGPADIETSAGAEGQAGTESEASSSETESR
jgi:trigger factor